MKTDIKSTYTNAERSLSEYFRIPEDSTASVEFDESAPESGFFRFGSDLICYGRYKNGQPSVAQLTDSGDASRDVRLELDTVHLPFDVAHVIDDLLSERYMAHNNGSGSVTQRLGRQAYYSVRGLLPDRIRRKLQRAYLGNWREVSFPNWPVDSTVDKLHHEVLRLSMQAKGSQRIPFIWFWPEGARNCLIMTHDVETSIGRDFTSSLMDLDESYGIKASFQVVPEGRYEVPNDYVNEIRRRGFELNIHDLNHDGLLFGDRREFLRRAGKINEYARKYKANGFRAGSMYRKQEWYDAFDFSYDMSIPSVAHLEPQRGGCCTVMPYFIGKILEMPLTMTQDYSLIHILQSYSTDHWKRQLALLLESHGLISFIVHPDYVIESRARNTYETLLDYLQSFISKEHVWATLPGEVDQWWRARAKMNLVPDGNRWKIEGPKKERACVAYAVLKDGHLTYSLD